MPSEKNHLQTIPVDLEKLKLIKVINSTGRTHIVGTNTSELKLWCSTKASFNPKIEYRGNGREIEIKIRPSNNPNFGVVIDFDEPDFEVAEPSEIFEEFEDQFDEPEESDYPPTPEGRLAYQKLREEYRRAHEEYREQRRRAREEYRQAREQAREERRRAREARREQEKRVREEIRRFKEETRKGTWRDYINVEINPSFIEQFVNFGENIRQAMEESGTFFLEVPAGVELEVKTTSGKIEVFEMKNMVRTDNTSGSTELHLLSGGAQVRNVSGKLDATELEGKLKIKSTSGSINLINCRLTSLDVETTSSNITARLDLIEPDEGDYKINTMSGRIRVRLPVLAKAGIECRTLSGRIVADGSFTNLERKNRPGQNYLKAELNGGGRTVTLNSISGKIEIGVYDPTNPEVDATWDVPVPPIPPVPPVPPVTVRVNTVKLQELARQIAARIREGMNIEIKRTDEVARREVALRFWDNYVQMKINLPNDEQRTLFDKVVEIIFGEEPAEKIEEETKDAPVPPDSSNSDQVLVPPPPVTRLWSERERTESPTPTPEPETFTETAPTPAPEVATPPASVSAPAPTPSKKLSQLEILEAVQRGELDIEEAMARLSEAEK